MNSRVFALILVSFTAIFAIESDNIGQEEFEALSEYFKQNPLNINTATVSDIYSLPYIDEVTAERIAYRIEDGGDIKSLSELVSEGILDPEYADQLSGCIIFDYGKAGRGKGDYSLVFKRRLERSRGYEEEIYLGNPSRFTHKLGYYSSEVTFNALIDKEPGEINYTDNMKGNLIYSDQEQFRVVLGGFSPSSYTGMLQNEGFSFDPYSLRSSSKFHDFTKTSPSAADYAGYNGVSFYKKYGSGRLTAYAGEKKISATLNEDGEIETVNLYAYSRTISEIDRYSNSGHRLVGAGWEADHFGFRYGASVTKEEFDRDLAENSSLKEGAAAEFAVSRSVKDWQFRSDAATDLDLVNLKVNAQKKMKDMTAGFYYGFIQKDKFVFSSSGLMLGSGSSEQVFGMKFKLKPAKDIVIISDNLIFYSDHAGTNLPGAQFSIATAFKSGNTVIEPSFKYKYREDLDEKFVSEETGIYNSRLKIVHQAGSVTISADMKYTADTDGGFGYVIGPVLNYRSGAFRYRLGGDIYYTKNGAIVYSSSADTGKYPALTSFSGTGKKAYFMTGYAVKTWELSAGISRHTVEDSDTFGSGYDLIDTGTVHSVEANFRYIF